MLFGRHLFGDLEESGCARRIVDGAVEDIVAIEVLPRLA